MVRIGRSLGKGSSTRPFQGIRFRIGMAMALALLPILLLGAVQAQSDFRNQTEARRSDLQLAAERTAAGAKSRLDSTAVLLQALRPESLQFFCEPRLTALVGRLDSLDGLARISATGRQLCASNGADTGAAWDTAVQGSDWFARLRAGEAMVLARAPVSSGSDPNLIVAIRLERPMGTFDGAMIALIPLSSLQPDVRDRALPEGSEAALTDGAGNILTATDVRAFSLRPCPRPAVMGPAQSGLGPDPAAGRLADRLRCGHAGVGADHHPLAGLPRTYRGDLRPGPVLGSPVTGDQRAV